MHVPNNKHPEIQRDGNVDGQGRNCCCCPCATRIMRWRGPLPAQSNYQLGILAAKHALNQPGESQSRCRLPEAAVMSRLVARCCRVDWGRRGVARHRCCRDEGMSRRRVLDLHPVAAAPLGARFMRPASHRPLTILPILHPTSTIPGPKL